MEKKELRKHIRQLKAQHTKDELRQMSASICERLLAHPKIQATKAVFAYLSMNGEVYTHDLVEQLFRSGKTILLPRVNSDTEMTLHRYNGKKQLQTSHWGIAEPTTPAITDEEANALLQDGIGIIPGMAFSKDGKRMGRGKGYYDRTLHNIRTMYKIGVCFPFQIYDQIPVTELDINMDEVIY